MTQDEDTAIEKPTPEPGILSPPVPVPSRESLDRQQTLALYDEAYRTLKDTIAENPKSFGVGLSDMPADIDDAGFIVKLAKALDSQNSEVKDRSLWNTCKSAVNSLCHALKPFTKNVLNVAMQGSAVLSVLFNHSSHR